MSAVLVRTVCVEVSHHENAALAMFQDQRDRCVDTVERAHGHEPVEREREFLAVADAPRRVRTAKNGVQREIGDFVARAPRAFR
jgi:hypothetical protein